MEGRVDSDGGGCTAGRTSRLRDSYGEEYGAAEGFCLGVFVCLKVGRGVLCAGDGDSESSG